MTKAIIKNLFFLFIMITGNISMQAQPKYAGSMKNIIGKKYTDSKHIPGLAGWQFREGSVVSTPGDDQPTTVYVFSKASTYIIFFSVLEDTASKKYVIDDLIELKNVTKNQEVKTAVCREYKKENVFIVALVTAASGHYSKAVKAWRFDRDRIRFEMINAKTVDCLNEGADQ